MSYSNPYFSGSSQAVGSPNVGLQYIWDGGINNSNGGWRPITTGDLLTVTLENAQLNVNLKKDEDTVNIYTDQGQEINVANTGHDNFNVNSNLQIGNTDVSDSNPVPVKTEYLNDSIETFQFTHDNLNANVNLQVGDTDVSDSNPVPVKTDYQNDSIEVFQTGHDNLNANANLQVGDADVSVSNPVNTQPVCPVLSNDESPTGTAASFNGNANIDNASETYSLTANTKGSAGNKTVSGNGSSAMSALAVSNDFAVNSGNSSLIPDNGTPITFTGGADAVQASGTFNGITYTAQTAGSAGNSISISVIGSSSEGITVNGNAITLFIISGTSTRQDVVNLINNSGAGSALVTVNCGSFGSANCLANASAHSASNLQNGDDGEFATFTGSVPVESKFLPVNITADSAGSSGNVTLTGNDSSTISQLVSTHNAGTGHAQLTVNSGGSHILNNGSTITLTGGADSESTAQEFYDSNNSFYYTKHSYVIKLSGTGSSASADITFLVKNDGINDFASIKNETVTWNPSTDGDQYLTYFDEFNFSSAKVSFDLTNCTAHIAETHTG